VSHLRGALRAGAGPAGFAFSSPVS
jgi:hypothetical protein